MSKDGLLKLPNYSARNTNHQRWMNERTPAHRRRHWQGRHRLWLASLSCILYSFFNFTFFNSISQQCLFMKHNKRMKERRAKYTGERGASVSVCDLRLEHRHHNRRRGSLSPILVEREREKEKEDALKVGDVVIRTMKCFTS